MRAVFGVTALDSGEIRWRGGAIGPAQRRRRAAGRSGSAHEPPEALGGGAGRPALRARHL